MVKANGERALGECKNKACLISSETRKSCAKCRFMKCLSVGK